VGKKGGSSVNNTLILIKPVYVDGLPSYNKNSEHTFGAVRAGAIKGNYEEGIVFRHRKTKVEYVIRDCELVEL